MAITILEVKISCTGEPDCKASMSLITFRTSGGCVDATKATILNAIKFGYRHFDITFLYDSEKPMGEAVAEALRNGLIHSWEELFITSKLWCTSAECDLVVPSIKTSLKICAGCKAEIGRGQFLSCMGGVWHPECLCCLACNDPITDYEPYHKLCYKAMHHPTCDICNNYLGSLNIRLIHSGCESIILPMKMTGL